MKYSKTSYSNSKENSFEKWNEKKEKRFEMISE